MNARETTHATALPNRSVQPLNGEADGVNEASGSGRRQRVSMALGAAVLAGLSLILAYYRMFTGFAEWDDEGTLMMTVRQFLDGSTLYEIVRSGYGPVYYYFNWLIRTLTFTPVTHDVTRATSMVLWALCAMACAWIVWRTGRSLAAALLTHVLVFRTLGFFSFEPGHPQELCMVLMLALTASGLSARWTTGTRVAVILAGALPAALLLVKINIGIFTALAVAAAMLQYVTRGPIANALRYAAGASAVVFPFLLMRAHLGNASEIAYCVAVTAGMAAILAGASTRRPLFSLRDCAVAAASFVITCALVLGVLVLQGAAPSTILDSLVLDQIKLRVNQSSWYMPMGLNPWWTVWALAGPVLAFFARRRGRSTGPSAFARIALSAVLFLLAVIMTNELIGLMTPFCWIIAWPVEEDRPWMAYGRTLLAATAVLQTLYAYPVAGSQGLFARVLLIVVAGICLADAVRDLPRWRLLKARGTAVGWAVVGAVLLSYPAQAWRARQFYLNETPLNLPGAQRIHLEREEAAAFQWMVGQLKQNCDTFVGYPGLPSLYFWTGKPMPGPSNRPPGPLNADAWTLLLNRAQQQAIVNEFAQHPQGCVIYHPSGVKFWNPGGADQSSLPLVDYVRKNFRTVGELGDYQFQIRNERPWSAPRAVPDSRPGANLP